MVQRNLAAMAKAAAARPVPPSAAEFESERARRRIELYKSLGLAFPPGKSPLNPQITGTLERKGYRIEKLVFESRPGFHVTAHLYIPDGAKSSPRPVVVNPNGHWSHKKNEPVVQARAAAQALLGYVAITVDSPGWSFEGNAKIERRFQGTHDDYRLIASSSNTTALYVYDLMRALDYLETRPEADMKKIAITGCSGGGLATVYAFAADDRYTCAIPVCYATSLEVSTANGCLCNHVPGTLQIGDRADVLSIQAPKPVFLIGATDDGEFPPQGHEASIHKMKSIWGLLGAAGNVKLQIFPSGHDYNKSMREAAYGFLQLHLRGIGDGSPVAEPELQLFDAEAPELFCQKDVPGNVRTMRDIAVDRLRSASFPARSFEDVIALNGGLPPAGSLARTVVGAPARRSQPDLAESFITIETSPGISVPGVELSHIPGGMGVLVYINDAGAAAARTGRVAELLATPDPPDVVAIDPRGIGELANLDGRLMAYLGVAPAFLGGADAARVAEYYINKGKRVVLAGDGPVAALMALFAGHMQPRIHGVATLRGLKDDVQCFDPAISAYAVQPRADCGAPLSAMRQWLKPRAWHRFAGESDPNADEWRKAIADLLR
jgi:dienelactone hydrolase